MNTSTTSSSRTLLVTGASGHLGRRTVELLLAARGADRIVAGSRDPGKLSALAAAGAETRRVDFDQPETLAAAFAGVDRVLIVSTDSVHTPGLRARQNAAAFAAARQAGVRHVVYTSFLNAVPDSAVSIMPEHVVAEAALAAGDLAHTILRNSYYAENNLPGWAHALRGGRWFAAAGEGAISYVAREDCAAAAAAALASTFAGRRTLDITGPEALTHAQVAKLLAEISGRPLAYEPVPVEAVVAGLKAAGLPGFLAEALSTFDTAAARGELSAVSRAVEELTGRRPLALRDFLQTNRSALTA